MPRFSSIFLIIMTFMGAFAPWAQADLFIQGDATPNVAGYTEVSVSANGTFTISNDTAVPPGFTLYQPGSTFTTSAQAYLGFSAGATGTVDITGSGAQWTTEIYTFLGNASGATGTVNVENGGQWKASNFVYVADAPGAKGIVNVKTGSAWTVAGDVHLGDYSGAVGTINIDGTGSQWQVTGGVILGESAGGTGNITVSNGAAATVTGRTDIGGVVGSSGSISVNGGTFTSGETWVAGNANASLSITNGGKFTNTDTFLGVAAFGSNITGTVTVDGAGSKLIVGGAAGNGTIQLSGVNSSIQVTNGGEIDGGAILSAVDASSQVTALISGTGSLWTGGMSIGLIGKGTVIVADGGKLQSSSFIGLGYNNTTDFHNGTLQIGNGGAPGTISASEIVGGLDGDGTGTVIFDHNSTNYTFFNDNGSGEGLKLTGLILVQVVAGTTSFVANDNDYTLGTQITGGRLMAENTSGSATGAGSVTVEAGGALGGKGRIAPGAGMSVSIAGTLAPGDTAKGGSTGKLTFALASGSQLLFRSGSVLDLNLVDGGVSDQVAFATAPGAGSEWLSGTNHLTLALNMSGANPYAQTYDIFDNAIGNGTAGQFTLAGITGYDTTHYQAEFFQSGNDYVLSFIATPEPSSCLLFGLGGFVLLRRRRVPQQKQ